MTDAEAFERSLEVVAENCEDPVPTVYEKVFKKFPEMQDLFVLDTDHGARGHMLNEALLCAQDLLSENVYATRFIAAERLNHEGYSISDNIFEAFFEIMRDVFKDIADDGWTPEMDTAWQVVSEKVATARL